MDLGSVLESELGQSMCRLKLVSCENNSGFKGFVLM